MPHNRKQENGCSNPLPSLGEGQPVPNDTPIRVSSPAGCPDTPGEGAASLPKLTARAHLLWILIEDALREEGNYSPEVVARWHDQLMRLSDSVEPLEFGLTSLGESEGSRDVRDALRFVRERLRGAVVDLEDSNRTPVNQIYSALDEIGRARVALLVLYENLRKRKVIPKGAVQSSPAIELKQRGFARDLRRAYEALLSVGQLLDFSVQCQESRNLYLMLYQLMTFNETAARVFYDPTLKIHSELVERMPPGITRECVRGRLNVLEKISPDRFESEALRVARGNEAVSHAG